MTKIWKFPKKNVFFFVCVHLNEFVISGSIHGLSDCFFVFWTSFDQEMKSKSSTVLPQIVRRFLMNELLLQRILTAVFLFFVFSCFSYYFGKFYLALCQLKGSTGFFASSVEGHSHRQAQLRLTKPFWTWKKIICVETHGDSFESVINLLFYQFGSSTQIRRAAAFYGRWSGKHYCEVQCFWDA